MSKQQIEFINGLLSEIEDEFPEAHQYITRESQSASTGLEYYGIIGSSFSSAFKQGLLPPEYSEKVKAINKAVSVIYGA